MNRIRFVAALTIGAVAVFCWSVQVRKPVPDQIREVAVGQIAPDPQFRLATSASTAVPPGRSIPLPPTSTAAPRAASTNVLSEFVQWLESYSKTEPAQKAASLPAGLQFVQARAQVMAALMQTNPAMAWDSSLSYAQRKAIPEELASWVEHPVNALADFEVIASTPASGEEAPPMRRGIRFDGQLYEGFTFGTGLEWTSETGKAINALVLPASATPSVALSPYPTGKSSGLAVISPNPVRVLDTVESTDYLKSLQAEPLCGVSGLPVTSLGSATVTQTAGNYTSSCRLAHTAAVQPEAVADDASGASTASTTTDLPTTATGSGIANTAWTKGIGKRYIFCRPVFTDYKGYTSDSAVFKAYTGYSNYVVHSSYGQLVPAPIGTDATQNSYVTPPLSLPGSVADYETGGKDITQDIIAAAHALGINFKKYQFFAIVNAGKPGFNAAGLGSIGPSMGTDGGSQSWCRLMGDTQSLDSSLLGHELGHNLYLGHSHGWNTSGRSVIGPGAHDEYGDPDSLMGATWGRDSYVANLRYYLGWISGPALRNVSGVGQVYQAALSVLDDNTNGVRAIRVKHPRYSQYYWLEFRRGRSWMDATEAANSIGLRWGSPNGSEAWSLNVAPDRLGASRLTVGHTFDDPSGDIHITPVGPSTSTPNAIDVTVAIGPFPDNHSPTASLSANILKIPVGGRITLTTTASDPENDPLAYGWDFGGTGNDGPGHENTNVVSHTFATAGTYNVRCEISDMKGGSTSASVSVVVGNPGGFTVSGKVVDENGTPVEGIKVRIDDTHLAFTDGSGAYSIGGLTGGTYSLAVSDPVVDGSAFEPWLTNPLSVQKNLPGVNFTALPKTQTGGMRVEYFSDSSLTQLLSVTRSPRIDYPNTHFPAAEGVRWTGLFSAPLSGTYLLHAQGDGTARIQLNGQSFVGTMNSSTGEEVTGYIVLATGQPCAFVFECSSPVAPPHFALTWTTPAGGVDAFTPDAITPGAGGLRGSYFANTSLTNLAFTRIDPVINFPSGVTAGPRLPGDHYSVRWAGKIRARNSGRYEFRTLSDDGVRLWVNGRRLINNWTDHGPTEDIGAISLSGNQSYDILLEYYQGGGPAQITLRWNPPGGTLGIIPASELSPAYSGLWAEYYNSTTLDGSPVITQTDPVVDLEPVADAPAPGIRSGGYSARWLGMLQAPATGTYQFSIWADDAIRFWVNGQKLLDNWGTTGARELTTTVSLSSGRPVPIRLELQQTGGNSGARLAWTPPGSTSSVVSTVQLQPVRPGLWAEYFNSPDFSGTPVSAFLEDNLNHTFTTAALPSGVTTNAFSARWHGQLIASANGSHNLILTSAGAARVYLDGTLFLDGWYLHTKSDINAILPLTAGQPHDLVVEFRSWDGTGIVQLGWIQPRLPRQSVSSVNLLPPAPPTVPVVGGLRRLNDHWQLSWDAGLGPLSLLTATDLRVPLTNWSPYFVNSFLSNGLWRANLPGTTNGQFYIRLNPDGQ